MDLVDYIIRLLLRYMRQGKAIQNIATPNISVNKDLEYLRMNWAVSAPINRLSHYVIENRFELQASTEHFLEYDDINVKGRIDAVKSILAQSITGHPTKVAYYSLNKSYRTGPNQVLGWVLANCYQYGQRWSEILANSEPAAEGSSRSAIRATLSLLNTVQRINIIKAAFGSIQQKGRPSNQVLNQTKHSRRTIYQLAYNAYIFLAELEKGNNDAIRKLLEETLVKPKEEYQILELALAIALAEAIAAETFQKVVLHEISPNSDHLLLRVGSISISWQTRTKYFRAPSLEPSELKLNDLLPHYNLNPSFDRPDLVVLDENSGKVLAIGEAKFFKQTFDAWRAPLRQALAQIVRYSRGYAEEAEQDALIARSCIALADYPSVERPLSQPINGPIVLDINDIMNATTAEWAQRVLHPF